jgi:hypothetical protein
MRFRPMKIGFVLLVIDRVVFKNNDNARSIPPKHPIFDIRFGTQMMDDG